MSASRTNRTLPAAIYVWLVPSEQVLEQPGHWRIRKWDTEPFPEANFTLSYGPADDAEHLRMQIGYIATELMVRGDPRSLPEIVETAAKATRPAATEGR